MRIEIKLSLVLMLKSTYLTSMMERKWLQEIIRSVDSTFSQGNLNMMRGLTGDFAQCDGSD